MLNSIRQQSTNSLKFCLWLICSLNHFFKYHRVIILLTLFRVKELIVPKFSHDLHFLIQLQNFSNFFLCYIPWEKLNHSFAIYSINKINKPLPLITTRLPRIFFEKSCRFRHLQRSPNFFMTDVFLLFMIILLRYRRNMLCEINVLINFLASISLFVSINIGQCCTSL